MAALLCLAGSLAIPPASRGLVFSDETTEPTQTVPPDFPYWDHVSQRRYEGPTVIYLGAGWALTARHVGRGARKAASVRIVRLMVNLPSCAAMRPL